MLSCIHTKWNQLSPRQTTVAVRRQSDGSDGQTGSLWGFLSDKKNSEHFHAFLSSDIQHSTFPHQPKAGGLPFLSRTGNVLHASHLQGFCILTFHKRIFHFTPAILMGLHSPMNPGSYSPASAQDTHTCEPSDAHGQQTKFATLRPPFFQKRSFVFLFFFWKNFCIFTFYKRTFCFTPAIPTGFHSSEPKAHLSYTLSSASVIPAGIIHSVFVPRLPVMVSLFHTPLAE